MAIEVNLKPHEVFAPHLCLVSVFGGRNNTYHPIARIKVRNYRLGSWKMLLNSSVTRRSRPRTKVIDEVIQVTDKNANAAARRLAREKGLFVGSSSGAYAWCAFQAAKKLGNGKVLVTLLPDSADRYFSTDLFKE